MSNKQGKSYTNEFKQQAVELAVKGDKSIAQTAKDLGVALSTLHGWIKKELKTDEKPSNSSSASLYDELKRLKKENARLRQEREILKKATAYFAKETV
jgi:transposase